MHTTHGGGGCCKGRAHRGDGAPARVHELLANGKVRVDSAVDIVVVGAALHLHHAVLVVLDVVVRVDRTLLVPRDDRDGEQDQERACAAPSTRPPRDTAQQHPRDTTHEIQRNADDATRRDTAQQHPRDTIQQHSATPPPTHPHVGEIARSGYTTRQHPAHAGPNERYA